MYKYIAGNNIPSIYMECMEMYYSGLLSWIILGYIPVRSEGFCVARLLIGNSTSQNITGRCRSHLIQKFRPRSSSVRKDVIKPAGVFKHMNGGNW